MNRVNLSITIGGVDVTRYVDLDQVQPVINSVLDKELDTLTLTLINADAVAPVEWQEIVVSDGSTILFGGYVITVDQIAGSNLANNNYILGCSDYAAIFDKVYVKAEYTGYTDAQIIAAAIASSSELSGFDAVTFVNFILFFPRARFNRKTVREILDWICQQTGGHWYVDYNKALHYFGSEEDEAPYEVTDDPNEAVNRTVEAVTVTKNGAGVVNLVDVVGGSKYSDDVTEYYTPSGYQPFLDLSKRYKAPSTLTKIQVKRNDGGATTNLIPNPSFEVNITDGWTQWQAGTGAAWVREANAGGYGSYVLRIDAGTSTAILTSGLFSLAPGERITASVLVWCSAVGKAGLRLAENGFSISDSKLNTLASTWQRLSATIQNNTGAAINVKVELVNWNSDSATSVYFDGVQLEKKAWPTAYCDGSLGTGYSWSGTAHNSTSVRIDMPIWTTLLVKTGGVDTLTKSTDVLYYESSSRLEQLANFPGIANGIEIFARYEMPMRSRLRNQLSHDHYGKWLQLVVNAPEIVDKAVGVMRGKAELAANAYANVAISYTTRQPGLRAGQMQRVKLIARKLDARYLIQRVTTTIGIAGYITARVELGAVDQNLVGVLLALKRSSAAATDWNENEVEVLDEVVDIAESLTLTEGTPTVAGSQGPYLWGSFNWDFGVWG